MVGIRSFGAYVPLYRISYEEMGKVWNVSAGRGERSVASQDEDSLTMAVEAAIDCMNEVDRRLVDGLFFASTTSPFLEKQASTTIAVAADLNRSMYTMDCTGSLRAGTVALKAAFDAVKAGSNKNVVVTASDCRMGFPGSMYEQTFGDGAAALLIGDTDVVANIEGAYSICDEITDGWRREGDRFVHFWEDRFNMVEGYQRVVPEAVKGAFQKYGLTAKDFAKVVLYAPNERVCAQTAQMLGFDVKTQLRTPIFSSVGNTGAAFALMELVACLETAKKGDRILIASYGNGSDVVILEVTDAIAEGRSRKGLTKYVASKKMLPNYHQFALIKEFIVQEESRMPPIRPPATVVWRDQDSILRFHGSKCTKCGHEQIPIHRICSNCGSKDSYEQFRVSDSVAKVWTCTVDSLGYGGEASPFWAIVDIGKARTRIEIADAELGEVKIGDPLEMTFRRFPRANDVPVYSWKGRIIR
jgi:3-hydroxy-3-methylglutaryl CoA synthase